MTSSYRILIVLVFSAHVTASSWNKLSCPAPRAPDNGLSFIFRNGEIVHFRCHPGYEMRGKPVAYCINNMWTNSAPECVPIRKGSDSSFNNPRFPDQWKQRELFQWGPSDVYGDGPRRLPLINGIWTPQEQVLALGPLSTPKSLVKEEIDIAELRQWQLEDLRRQRFQKNAVRRAKNVYPNSSHRETVLSLGATEDGEAFSVALANPNNDTVKHRKHRHRKFPAVSSRKSRVNTNGHRWNIAELRRKPVELVHRKEPEAAFDSSCVEIIYRRQVPMIAPQIPNAFVYRYETKRNQSYPFNKYMEVKYKCLNGFVFATNAQTLYCKEASWIGDFPRCVSN